MKKLGLIAALGLSLVLFAGGSRPTVGVGSGVSHVAGVGRDRSGVGVGVASIDTMTYVFTTNDSMVHYSAEYAADVAAALASGGDVFELGDELDYAFSAVKSDDPDGNYTTSYARQGRAYMPNTPTTDRWKYGATGQIGRLLWIDFSGISDVLPQNGSLTVLSCQLNEVIQTANLVRSQDDTTCVTLLTNPNDGYWYQSANRLVVPAVFDHYASAAWNYQWVRQDQPIYAGYAPAGTSSNPWSFGSFSTWVWNIGSVHDMTNAYPDSCGGWGGCGSGISLRAGNIDHIPMTNCVQAILNGETNNGLFISGRDVGTTRTWNTYNWETDLADKTRAPWITLKVATRRHLAPYPNGKSGAIMFQTDDQVASANLAYLDSLDAHGWPMTICVRKDQMGDGSRLTYAQLLSAWEAGHEVTSHTQSHNSIAGAGNVAWYGLNYWRAQDAITATDWVSGIDIADLDSAATSTQWDYLLADSDPAWLYQGLVDAGGDLASLTASVNCNSGLSLPGGAYSPAVIRAAAFHGYKYMRLTAAARVYDSAGYAIYRSLAGRGDFDTPLNVAEADTGWAYSPQFDPTMPRNLMLEPLTIDMTNLVGDGTARPTEYQVRLNMRRYLTRLLATGDRRATLFAHDLMTVSGGIYDGGIDPDILVWALSTADSMNFWVCTTAEENAWRRAHATPVSTPAGYPNTPAFTASDRVWFEPWKSSYRPKE